MSYVYGTKQTISPMSTPQPSTSIRTTISYKQPMTIKPTIKYITPTMKTTIKYITTTEKLKINNTSKKSEKFTDFISNHLILIIVSSFLILFIIISTILSILFCKSRNKCCFYVDTSYINAEELQTRPSSENKQVKVASYIDILPTPAPRKVFLGKVSSVEENIYESIGDSSIYDSIHSIVPHS
jgi:hypothetical protein